MAMKQKDREFVVRNGEPGKKNFVENGVHCYCDTFLRRYPDEIATLAARQSGSNIDASETPRLRLFEKGRLWLEDGGMTAKRLEQVQWRSLGGK